MAIEPIKGFYVHDEETDTDGIAKYDAGALENLDRSLTERYRAPDSKAVGDRLSAVEAVADEANQIAERLNEGGLELKDEVLAENISAWLNEHPEATTTVEDGALTQSKLSNSLDARKPSFYSTVSEMQEDEQYRLGATAISDGAVYTVRSAVEVNDPEDMVDPSVLYKYDGQYYHGGLTESDREIATGYECVNGFAIFVADYKNAYVTPEMFGAKGDGVTDDTRAWQKAVDVGLPVVAKSAQYKCGQINVIKNISVDCNNADFICTGDKLFYCYGEVVATLSNENDYTANTQYSISNTEYANYTGFAMLKGTNNFEKARDYYVGGFVCLFYNGKLCNTYPIDVTNVSIEIINPIIVHFKNIGELTHTAPRESTRTIELYYGYGCTAENVKVANGSSYMMFALWSCLNCHIKYANVGHTFTSSTNNSYIVAFLDSSFCSVTYSHLYNEKWHSVTTGGNYLCYRNKISDGAYLSSTNYGVLDHDNAIGTLVENADISGGCGVAGRGVVKNISILPNDANMCFLQLRPSSNINNAIYYAENIHLKETRATPAYTAVRFQISPQTTGNTYYVKTATLRNIFQTETANGNIEASVVSGSTIDLREVIVDNTNMNIFVCKTGGNNVDVSNSKLLIQNVNQPSANTRPALGANGYEFNYVSITNSFLKNLMGTYADVLLCNVNFQGRPSSANTTITGSLTGNNVLAKIENSVLVQPNRVSIANMWYANTDVILFNITKDNNGNVFGFRVLNGEWTKIAIT